MNWYNNIWNIEDPMILEMELINTMNKLVNVGWLITVLIGIALLIAAGMQRFYGTQNTLAIITLSILFVLAFVIALFITSIRSYHNSDEFKNDQK